MKQNLLLFFFLFILVAEQLIAQDQPRKEYFAGECSKTDITIDGKIEEPAGYKQTGRMILHNMNLTKGKLLPRKLSLQSCSMKITST